MGRIRNRVSAAGWADQLRQILQATSSKSLINNFSKFYFLVSDFLKNGDFTSDFEGST